MKNILKKFGKILIFLQIFFQFASFVFADNHNTSLNTNADSSNNSAAAGVINTVFIDEEKCIDENTIGDNKIIQIIEEPLNFMKSPDDEDLEIRSCYRNTIIYSSKTLQSPFIRNDLLRKCSPSGQSLAAQYNDPNADFMIAFSCREVQAVISSSGKSLLFNVIRTFYFWGGGMAGIISVTVIVLSGIQISASGGDSEATSSAKKRIIKSLSAIALLFLSGLLLNTINPNFFVS